jgi:hypothetical protein
VGIFDHLAEERIKDAIEKGELDDLPGAGRPLELEDLSRVPEELRTSYLVLKNAGVLPEELVLRKELVSLQRLLAACRDDDPRATELRDELNAVELRYLVLLEHRLQRHVPSAYRAKLARRRFG